MLLSRERKEAAAAGVGFLITGEGRHYGRTRDQQHDDDRDDGCHQRGTIR